MDQNRTNDEIQFHKAKAYTKVTISSELFHKKAKFEKTNVMKSILCDYLVKYSTVR